MAAATSVRIDEEPTVATFARAPGGRRRVRLHAQGRRVSRAGAPHLTVELADSTGTIPARAFRDADVLAGRFERGEPVRVRVRAERFRAELQIALEAIARPLADAPQAARARAQDSGRLAARSLFRPTHQRVPQGARARSGVR